MERQESSQEEEAPALSEAEAQVHVSVLGERSYSIHGSPTRCWRHAASERLVLWDGHVHRCHVSMEGLEC